MVRYRLIKTADKDIISTFGRDVRRNGIGPVMVHSMRPLDWTMGCPDIWFSITLDMLNTSFILKTPEFCWQKLALYSAS